MNRRLALLFVAAVPAALALAQPRPYAPDARELAANYQRADALRNQAMRLVTNSNINAKWVDGTTLAYVRTLPNEKRIMLLSATNQGKRPAFDHAKAAVALAKAMRREVTADAIPFEDYAIAADLSSVSLRIGQEWWKVDLKAYTAEKTARPIGANAPGGRGPGGGNAGGGAPQVGGRVRVQDGQVQLRDGENWRDVGTKNDYGAAQLTPDGSKVVAFKLFPGDRKKAFLLESTPSAGGTRAVLRERLYDQPGDKLDTYETWVIDAKTGAEQKSDVEPILGGGQPWSSPPRIQFWKSGTRGLLRFMERGYQEYKVVELDMSNATSKVLIDEKEATFVDSGNVMFETVDATHEIVWRSERDRWGHLYLIDGDTGAVKNQITKGEWVVRGIDRVDLVKRQILFRACGREKGEDPYQIDFYRVNFDGTGLVRLTDGDGTHTVAYSPDRTYFVDTWSRTDKAPVYDLRSSEDGRLIAHIEESDASALKREIGVNMPERFVAKGRDGKTDIWGVIVRPTFWQAGKKFPVIENIYAGPHDSFVPKSFSAYTGMHALAELGFIVVQIDGMGTNNRGKDFQDVCWRNLKDAGFPDRILWMKAAAAKDPTMDLDRVGIYGTSAGGQESTAAMLFHPEFYKVAVSSCGCHDNRIDKYWWNEQWMGYPVGPWYSESSNIDNAAKLQGNLLLMVGELDTNVPPESTYKLVDALERAEKDFDFVVIPGSDHTAGGPYGERKRRDFFVRHLLGIDPPAWNSSAGK